METRLPAVSGVFYPGEKQPLLHLLERYFGEIKDIQQNCLGVISPHAGYEYSGKTAAYAVSSLKNAETFIIFGPNHQSTGGDFAVSLADWKTPLGKVPVNHELAKSLELEADESAHRGEHSIEIQLPVLQYRFKNFDFVPVSVMSQDYSEHFLKKCRNLGRRISEVMKDRQIGVIASSDFSHYLPRDQALKKDDKAIERILDLDTEGFFSVLEKSRASICGFGPIAVLMEIGKKLKLNTRKIHHSTSADVTGDIGSVVTYNTLGFY